MDDLQLHYIVMNDLLSQLGVRSTAGFVEPPSLNPTTSDFTNPWRSLTPTPIDCMSYPPRSPTPIDSTYPTLSLPPAPCPRTSFDQEGALGPSTSFHRHWSPYTTGTPTTPTAFSPPGCKRKRRANVTAKSSQIGKPKGKAVQRERKANVKYLTAEERKILLENDPFVSYVEGYSNLVHCSGCDRDIQLDNRVPETFHLQNWKTHKSRCPGIKKGIDRNKRVEIEIQEEWIRQSRVNHLHEQSFRWL